MERSVLQRWEHWHSQIDWICSFSIGEGGRGEDVWKLEHCLQVFPILDKTIREPGVDWLQQAISSGGRLYWAETPLYTASASAVIIKWHTEDVPERCRVERIETVLTLPVRSVFTCCFCKNALKYRFKREVNTTTRHKHVSSESQVMAVESILVWDKKSSPAYTTNGTEHFFIFIYWFWFLNSWINFF